MLLVQVQEKLFDIGFLVGELLILVCQVEYGVMMLCELCNYGYLLEDLLVNDWLQIMGVWFGFNSDQSWQLYIFFVMNDCQINVFVMLGGYIGVNVGLVLIVECEDEVVVVLFYEIVYVIQQYVLCGVECVQCDQILILLGMLVVVVVVQVSNSMLFGNVMMVVISLGMGLMQQWQINYICFNEFEVDCFGICILLCSGYDVDVMVGFFEWMLVVMCGNEGGYSVFEFLCIYLVNIICISEVKFCVQQMKKDMVLFIISIFIGECKEWVDLVDFSLGELLLCGNNLLLFGSVLCLLIGQFNCGVSGDFEWVCECLCVFSVDFIFELECEYVDLVKWQKDGFNDVQCYGQVLVVMCGGCVGVGQVWQILVGLLQSYFGNLWLVLGLGEVELCVGQVVQVNSCFEQLLCEYFNSCLVVLIYVEILNE